MFLDDDQLHELTGYRQPSKQIGVLKSQGIPYYVNASGHPKVVTAILESRKQQVKNEPKEWVPKWAGNLR